MKGNRALRQMIQEPFILLGQHVETVTSQCLSLQEIIELAARLPSFDTYEKRLKEAGDFKRLVSELDRTDRKIEVIMQIILQDKQEQETLLAEMEEAYQQLQESLKTCADSMSLNTAKIIAQIMEQLRELLTMVQKNIEMLNKRIVSLEEDMAHYQKHITRLEAQIDSRSKTMKESISAMKRTEGVKLTGPEITSLNQADNNKDEIGTGNLISEILIKVEDIVDNISLHNMVSIQNIEKMVAQITSPSQMKTLIDNAMELLRDQFELRQAKAGKQTAEQQIHIAKSMVDSQRGIKEDIAKYVLAPKATFHEVFQSAVRQLSTQIETDKNKIRGLDVPPHEPKRRPPI